MRIVEDVVTISPVYAFIYVAKSADGFIPEPLWLPQAAERARISAAENILKNLFIRIQINRLYLPNIINSDVI
jgi:hypothetical protein